MAPRATESAIASTRMPGATRVIAAELNSIDAAIDRGASGIQVPAPALELGSQGTEDGDVLGLQRVGE